MKLHRFLAASALLIVPLMLAGPSPSSAEPLRIGVSVPLTGPAANFGVGVKNALLLAQEKFDPKGDVQFTLEDNAYQNTQVVSSYRKLRDIDKVNALLVLGSGASVVLADQMEKERVPSIALAVTTSVPGSRAWMMKIWEDADETANVLVAELKRRKLQRVAIASIEIEAAENIKAKFKARYQGELIDVGSLPPQENDLRSIATNAIAAKPDVIFSNFFGQSHESFIVRLREFGYNGPIMAQSAICEAPGAQSERTRPEFDGVWFASADDLAAEPFYQQYRSRFGRQGAFFGAAIAYDAAAIMIVAAQRGWKGDTPLTVSTDGIDTLLPYSSQGRTLTPSMVIKEFRQGSIVLANGKE